MRILVITQYYHPEPGATTNRLMSFVDAMVKRGHKVTVICEFPNHPVGVLSPEDKWRLFRVEDAGSCKIVRTFVLTFSDKNNIKRMMFYLSFAISSFIAALFLRRHDVIFASSPPIFHTYTAMLAAKIKRSKFVADIRDLWPDSALAFEAVSNNTLLRLGGILEKQIYSRAVKIFTVTKGLKEKIENRGGKNKVSIAYNGSFEDMLNWDGDKEEFRKNEGWTEKTVICYAGIIGLGQNLVNLLPEILSLDNDEYLFEFIGDGPQRLELIDKIKEMNFKNVRVRESVPVKDIIPYIYCSDIMLVVLRESSLFRSAIPSKFFDYMAAGKPVVTNVDGELREIMEDNKTGIYFSFKQPGLFKKAIEELSSNREKLLVYGKNGKKLVVNRFLRRKLAENMVLKIEKTVRQTDDNY